MSDGEARDAERAYRASPDDEAAAAAFIAALVRAGRLTYSRLAPAALEVAENLERLRVLEADRLRVLFDDPAELCASCGGHPRRAHSVLVFDESLADRPVDSSTPIDDAEAECRYLVDSRRCPCSRFVPLLRRARGGPRLSLHGVEHLWDEWERRRLGHLGDAWVRACRICGLEMAFPFVADAGYPGSPPRWGCPSCFCGYHGGDPRETTPGTCACGCRGPTLGAGGSGVDAPCFRCSHIRRRHEITRFGVECRVEGCRCGYERFDPEVALRTPRV